MASRNPTSSPLSSAQSSQATFQTASSQSQPTFRPAQVLPFELLQQVKVYLEESLFTQALRFLQGLLSTTAADEKKKALIPPPDYLTLLASLTVHPSFTTRASTSEKIVLLNASIKFLWTVNSITGPVNSRLTEAYRFRRFDAGGSRRNGTILDDDKDVGSDHLNSHFADAENLFSLAEDFWAVVGWALNCSCLPGVYTARWNYWYPWLEYMLDVLEKDWEVREEMNATSHSLLWQYLKCATGGTARGRRILRAIFASGSPMALREFREIFRKELKERRTNKDKEKDKKQEAAVDIDQEVYGDWLQEESTSTDEDEDTNKRDDMLPSRPSKRLRVRNPRNPNLNKPLLLTETDDSDVSASTQDDRSSKQGLGPPSAITIRLRLLQLLSNFSAHLTHSTSNNSDIIFPDLHELYTLYVEFIRPLPLSTFQQIVLPLNPTKKDLQTDSRIALCEFILQRLVDTSDSTTPNLGMSTFESMTQTRLVTEYLPFAAGRNNTEAQAKVSVLLEGLLRLLTRGNNDVLRSGEELSEAVRLGVEKREKKAQEIREGPRYKKGLGSDEEVAWLVLRESGMRMKFVVENFVKDG